MGQNDGIRGRTDVRTYVHTDGLTFLTLTQVEPENNLIILAENGCSAKY